MSAHTHNASEVTFPGPLSIEQKRLYEAAQKWNGGKMKMYMTDKKIPTSGITRRTQMIAAIVFYHDPQNQPGKVPMPRWIKDMGVTPKAPAQRKRATKSMRQTYDLPTPRRFAWAAHQQSASPATPLASTPGAFVPSQVPVVDGLQYAVTQQAAAEQPQAQPEPMSLEQQLVFHVGGFNQFTQEHAPAVAPQAAIDDQLTSMGGWAASPYNFSAQEPTLAASAGVDLRCSCPAGYRRAAAADRPGRKFLQYRSRPATRCSRQTRGRPGRFRAGLPRQRRVGPPRSRAPVGRRGCGA
ncbi:hypothetical protein BDV96DRAFT_632540 [Lophiotrema nucula]|uniref:Uncharacterized protein n=1 Tax=Lophiotrema nucula TaxID=690887 RepID=A0A6A5Z4M5_9PLEO|nr:hypothetical protein BDV96DRAFT_632540 [Lophiotrema nucula]